MTVLLGSVAASAGISHGDSKLYSFDSYGRIENASVLRLSAVERELMIDCR